MIHENEYCLKNNASHLCWSAIFAGAFVGIGLGFLLHLFSVAIGLSAYSSGTDTGAQTILIGGMLGLLIGVIVSMGAAGYVAGYLGRLKHCYCHGGIIYGFVTWSMALVLSAVLIIPLTHYMSFYKYSLANTVVAKTSTSQNMSSQAQQGNSATPLEDKATPKELAWSGWIMFVLFFIGAFASCLGACFGMICKREAVNDSSTPPPIH
jgi:hypothetical protein